MTFTDLYGAPRLWESALTVLPGSKAARMLRSVALERVAEAWRSAGEPARLVPKLPELWAWLAASPGLGERRGTVTAFAWAILDAGPADGFQVDDLDRLLTALVELRDELEAAGDGRRRAEVAEVHQRLAARRAEWAR